MPEEEELKNILATFNIEREEEEFEDIDAVTKGKGKGKGKKANAAGKGYNNIRFQASGPSAIGNLITALKAVQARNGAGATANPNAEKICSNCNKKGHIAKVCRQPIVEKRSCNKCGKVGHLGKDCRVRINGVEEVEPEAEGLGDAGSIEWGIQSIEWSCPPCDPIIRFGTVDVVENIDEPPELVDRDGNVMPEYQDADYKVYQDDESDDEVLGDVFPIEPKTSGEWEAFNLRNQGLEPGYRKKIKDGYRLTFVMDSGAVKTIVPPAALPNLNIKKTVHTGKTFRVANGQEILNLGETTIIGTNPINGGKMKFNSQVANIVKPLASANEMVDAGNLIIMHKDGGAIKKLSSEDMAKIIKLIHDTPGAEVPIKRQAGSFNVDVDVKEEQASVSEWTMAKKPVKPREQVSKMEVDFISRSRFEGPSKEDILSGFQRLFG